jgi:hypothetical protein
LIRFKLTDWAMRPLHPPFRVYRDDVDICDRNQHVCTAADADLAALIVGALNECYPDPRLALRESLPAYMERLFSLIQRKRWDTLWRQSIPTGRNGAQAKCISTVANVAVGVNGWHLTIRSAIRDIFVVQFAAVAGTLIGGGSY